MDRDTCEAWAERAAIMEYDGGLDRKEAERRASEITGYTPISPDRSDRLGSGGKAET